MERKVLAFCLTPGNVDDRKPVPMLVSRLFGDKGYLSQPLYEDERALFIFRLF